MLFLAYFRSERNKKQGSRRISTANIRKISRLPPLFECIRAGYLVSSLPEKQAEPDTVFLIYLIAGWGL